MRTLLFKNNVHSIEPVEIPNHGQRAVNLTVRKGLKWSDLKVGEIVEIQETDNPPPSGAPESYVKIFDVKVMTFYHLLHYGRMLELEHDPDCRTFSGLFHVMKKVYDGFLQHELVTLVFYELLPTE